MFFFVIARKCQINQNLLQRGDSPKKNIAKFCRCLGRVEWDNVFNNNNAQDAFTVLQRVIDQLMDDIFPEPTITMTYKTRQDTQTRWW